MIQRCQFQATKEDLLLGSFAASFLKPALILYTFFHDFIHWGWGQGQITPMGKFCVSQETVITLNICSKFQKDCFEL